MRRQPKNLIQDFARQAIETKYMGPTNHRGARIKATCIGGSLIVNWDHSLDVFENHAVAAERLMDKLKWTSANDFAGGQLKSGSYVFVMLIKGVKS